MRHELELRNVPLLRLQEYLQMAGGTLHGERHASGAGWHADLIALEPVRLHTMHIRRDLLVIDGDDEAAVAQVVAFMRRQTMRGGG